MYKVRAHFVSLQEMLPPSPLPPPLPSLLLSAVAHRRCNTLLTPSHTLPPRSTRPLLPSPPVVRTRRTSRSGSSFVRPRRRGPPPRWAPMSSRYVTRARLRWWPPPLDLAAALRHQLRVEAAPFSRPGRSPFRVHGGHSSRSPRASGSATSACE
jgi:hypothetical protein